MNKINGFPPDYKDFSCDALCSYGCTGVVCFGFCVTACGPNPLSLGSNFADASLIGLNGTNYSGEVFCE